MPTVILQDLPFHLTEPERRTWFQVDDSQAEAFAQLLRQAEAVARPKALYLAAGFRLQNDDQVEIEGVRFQSRVLRVNLETASRVFPFVATCGVELEAWALAQTEPGRGWARALCGLALGHAVKSLEEHLDRRHQTGRLGAMKPGSIPDWPLAQQQPLFALLGEVKQQVGVELQPDFFMRPTMTISGVYFPSAEGFASCRLCARSDCPGRLAPYDPTLYDRKFRAPSKAEEL